LLEAPPTARQHAGATSLLRLLERQRGRRGVHGRLHQPRRHGVDNGTGAAVRQITGFLTQPQALIAEPSGRGQESEFEFRRHRSTAARATSLGMPAPGEIRLEVDSSHYSRSAIEKA
jgi:hypothetical protein